MCILAIVAGAISASAENWPCWRGPRLDGTSVETKVPLHWSASSNLLWKTQVPGESHSSPIVHGESIFVVSADTESQERLLLRFNVADGKLAWRQTVLTSPLERKHSLNSYASSTPATDGETIYVAFLDRKEMLVAAYDYSGKQKWQQRPGPFSSMHGFCSSPLIHKDLVLVNGDHDGDSYLVALKKSDGSTVWKTPRANKTRSYCVPLIRDLAGKTQMILSGDKCVASYDPQTGRQHWIIDGPTEQFVASPVHSSKTGLVYITGGFPEHHILAIRPDGSGNVTDSHIVWRTKEGAAYVPSPIIAGEYLFIIADSGIAHCFNAANGELKWKQRFGEQHASLLQAEDRVYFLNDRGVMNVIKVGPTIELLARNEIGEKCFATPAISQGRIFIRGETHLFCVGNL